MAERHTVRENEGMLIIASTFGFRNWRTIYEHHGNAALRATRPNPHILYEGDEVFIPDKEPREIECDTGNRHQV